MAPPQYVFVMQKLSKTYPGGKQVLSNISLSFLPDAKIGVVGVNGSGESTLLKIMAGVEKEHQGEAWAADGVRVAISRRSRSLTRRRMCSATPWRAWRRRRPCSTAITSWR